MSIFKFLPCLLLFSSLLSLPAFADSYPDELVSKARALKLHEQVAWHKLLRYKSSFWGGVASEADGPLWFFAAEGKSDPSSELEATLRAFFVDPETISKDPKDNAQHPMCQFPARFRWLQKNLSFDLSRFPKADCSRFLKFAANTAAQSVTIVFSSYYLNNPSSTFGHSLIRLNKSADSATGARFELLDYGINYAATADDGNALVYAIKGLTGLYRGTFTSIPYYYKVREYNDHEARDLWSYDIKLEPEQVQMLVAHLWELGSTYFDYYYFTENCSYHILTALEAAAPELDIVEKLRSVVIPADTIRVIGAKPDFVTGVHYRPSIRAQFEKRIETLEEDELDALDEVARTHDPAQIPTGFAAEKRARVLDAAADYIDLYHARAMIDRESKPSQWKQQILLARAQIPIASREIAVPVPQTQMPHLGHSSRRLGVSGGADGSSVPFTQMSYRFALHDLLDLQIGYPEFAQIEMFHLAGRYQDRKFALDELSLFQITSLTPLSRYQKGMSWRAKFGGTRFRDPGCKGCFGLGIEGGAGFTQLLGSRLAVFEMLEGEFSASPSFSGAHFRLGVGPMAGVRLRATDTLSLLAWGGYRYRPTSGSVSNPWAEVGVRQALGERFAVNLGGTLHGANREASLGFFYYH